MPWKWPALRLIKDESGPSLWRFVHKKKSLTSSTKSCGNYQTSLRLRWDQWAQLLCSRAVTKIWGASDCRGSLFYFFAPELGTLRFCRLDVCYDRYYRSSNFLQPILDLNFLRGKISYCYHFHIFIRSIYWNTQN